MIGLFTALLLNSAPLPALQSGEVELVISEIDGLRYEEYSKVVDGKRVMILVPSAHPLSLPTLSGIVNEGKDPAQYSFSDFEVSDDGIALLGTWNDWNVTRYIQAQADDIFQVTDSLSWAGEGSPTLAQAISSYRFSTAVNGEPAKLTSGRSPWPHSNLLPDHFLKTPYLYASTDDVSVALIADVNFNARRRPLPSAVHYDSGDSYSYLGLGKANLVRGEDRSYETGPPKAVPSSLTWRYDLDFGAGSRTEASQRLWLENSLGKGAAAVPQTVPFYFHTKPVYSLRPPLGSTEESEGFKAHWRATADGLKIGGPAYPPKVEFYGPNNVLRAAYGMRAWGTELRQTPWLEISEEWLNLILTAEVEGGALPGSYDRETRVWGEAPETHHVGSTALWLLRAVRDLADWEGKEQASKLVEDAVESLTDSNESTALQGDSLLFLQEYAGIDGGEPKLKARAAEVLSGKLDLIMESAADSGNGSLNDAVSLAKPYPAVARAVVEEFLLDQAVWDMPHRPTVPVFGALGRDAIISQHSSQDALKVMEIGRILDDKVIFERGAAALRASIALLGYTTALPNGIRHPKSVDTFWMSGGFGANGKDNFSPMVGFAEGAGQLMTSLWLSESRYGGMFEGKSGWKVGIDGVYVGEDGEPYSSLAFNPVPYFGHHPVTERSDRKPDVVHDSPRLEIGIRTVVPVLRDGSPSLAAVPGGVLEIDPETLSGAFELAADGTKLTTQLGPLGFEVAVDPDAVAAGPVSFAGKAGEKALSFGPIDVFVDPPLSSTAMAPRGWIRSGDLSDCNYPSLSFGSDKLVSTGDLGYGGLHAEPIGEVRTPPFLVWRDSLSFSWRGGDGCYIELTDARTDQMLLRTHGSPGEFQAEEWDLKPFRGARAVLRLIDPSKNASVSAIKFKMAG